MAGVVLTMLLVLYPLSPGPLGRYYKGKTPPPALTNLYAPLKWLYENNKTVEAGYDWYFHVWDAD